MAAVRHLGFVWAYLDHPLRVLGGLYYCAKFCYDPFSSLDNRAYERFNIWHFWLETPTQAPKIVVLGLFDSLSGLKYQRKPKGTHWVIFHLFAQEPPWTDFQQILYRCKSYGHNHLWQIVWRSVKGRRFCGGLKMDGTHWLSHWLLTLLAQLRSWVIRISFYLQVVKTPTYRVMCGFHFLLVVQSNYNPPTSRRDGHHARSKNAI